MFNTNPDNSNDLSVIDFSFSYFKKASKQTNKNALVNIKYLHKFMLN